MSGLTWKDTLETQYQSQYCLSSALDPFIRRRCGRAGVWEPLKTNTTCLDTDSAEIGEYLDIIYLQLQVRFTFNTLAVATPLTAFFTYLIRANVLYVSILLIKISRWSSQHITTTTQGNKVSSSQILDSLSFLEDASAGNLTLGDMIKLVELLHYISDKISVEKVTYIYSQLWPMN